MLMGCSELTKCYEEKRRKTPEYYFYNSFSVSLCKQVLIFQLWHQKLDAPQGTAQLKS